MQQTISAVFDDNFGLSDGDSSEEEGEEIYPYLGEPEILRNSVKEMTNAIENAMIDDHDSDASSESSLESVELELPDEDRPVDATSESNDSDATSESDDSNPPASKRYRNETGGSSRGTDTESDSDMPTTSLSDDSDTPTKGRGRGGG